MKKTKPGCFIGLFIILLFIAGTAAGIFYEMTPERQKEETKEAAASAASEQAEIKRNTILDVTQFAGISTDKLIKIMGKPNKVITGNGNTDYDYTKTNYWCEFTAWDGIVKELVIYSPKYETNKGNDFPYYERDDSKNLRTFGVTEQYQPKVFYNNLTLDLSHGVTDTITEMKFSSISDDKKTFQILFVTYC